MRWPDQSARRSRREHIRRKLGDIRVGVAPRGVNLGCCYPVASLFELPRRLVEFDDLCGGLGYPDLESWGDLGLLSLHPVVRIQQDGLGLVPGRSRGRPTMSPLPGPDCSGTARAARAGSGRRSPCSLPTRRARPGRSPPRPAASWARACTAVDRRVFRRRCCIAFPRTAQTPPGHWRPGMPPHRAADRSGRWRAELLQAFLLSRPCSVCRFCL